jgi:hypothetical protein
MNWSNFATWWHGKVYATHMRSYSDQLIESISEQLLVARMSGCRLQISHLQGGRAKRTFESC